MTKARKVVMAAFAGSMLLGSMPAVRAGTTEVAKISLGMVFVAVGVSAVAGLSGEQKYWLIARIMGAFATAGGVLLLKDGIGGNEEEKRKKLINEVRRDVVTSMKSGDSLKHHNR